MISRPIPQPYPAYKPSHVDWLGDIPMHWEVRRLRTVAEMRVSNVDKHTKEDELPVRLCNYVDVYKNDRITQAIPFMRATASRDEVKRFGLKPGDVLITKDSEAWDDIGVPALVAESSDDLLSGYHLALLRPFRTTIGAYLALALQSKGVAYQFHVGANGVTRYGLTHTTIQSICLPLPPLPEQRAIVRYLDHVDDRIRRYVSAKEKLIALLEEERQAVIHRAVTRGLDPNVRLKPSCVEWLGDVPAHWEVRRLKHLLIEPLKYGANEPAQYADPHLPRYIRITDIREDGALRDDSFRSLPEEIAEHYLLAAGDILFARSGATVGKTFQYKASWGRAAFAGYLIRARLNLNTVKPDFVEYFTQSQGYRYWLSGIFIQSTIQNVNAERYSNLILPLPPLPEQTALVDYLDKATTGIDAAINRARRQIELLREYRTRLIADVVTGKLDVRDAAANLPERAGE